jgi:hypothetical protein
MSRKSFQLPPKHEARLASPVLLLRLRGRSQRRMSNAPTDARNRHPRLPHPGLPVACTTGRIDFGRPSRPSAVKRGKRTCPSTARGVSFTGLRKSWAISAPSSAAEWASALPAGPRVRLLVAAWAGYSGAGRYMPPAWFPNREDAIITSCGKSRNEHCANSGDVTRTPRDRSGPGTQK